MEVTKAKVMTQQTPLVTVIMWVILNKKCVLMCQYPSTCVGCTPSRPLSLLMVAVTVTTTERSFSSLQSVK